MKLYRTCAPKTADIEHFLDNTDEIQAIQSILSTQSMLEEVFSRAPSGYFTRFCPPGFAPIPIYVSESDMTTFYEFCFHLLNNRKIIADRPVKAALYYLSLSGNPKINDIAENPPKGVMSKDSYTDAHTFVKKLNPFPDAIRYRSVRDLDGNINYAIYSKQWLTEDSASPKAMIISFVDEKTVDVIIGKNTYRILPNF